MISLLLKQESSDFSRPEIHVLTYNINPDRKMDGYCRAVDCLAIDMFPIEISGKKYFAITSGNALSVDSPVPTLFINDDLVLFGTVLLATENGLLASDIQEISEYLRRQEQKLHEWISEAISSEPETVRRAC